MRPLNEYKAAGEAFATHKSREGAKNLKRRGRGGGVPMGKGGPDGLKSYTKSMEKGYLQGTRSVLAVPVLYE